MRPVTGTNGCSGQLESSSCLLSPSSQLTLSMITLQGRGDNDSANADCVVMVADTPLFVYM